MGYVTVGKENSTDIDLSWRVSWVCALGQCAAASVCVADGGGAQLNSDSYKAAPRGNSI